MKKLILWLDEDGELHIAEPAVEIPPDYFLAVVTFEDEEPFFFSDKECEDEIGIER